MSFFARMYNEVGNALSDAYAHVLYGDDAGKSAKLVYIVRSRKVAVPVVPPGNAASSSASSSCRYDHRRRRPSSQSSSSSSPRPIDPTDPAFSGVSGGGEHVLRWMYDPGLTFLEVNGRAYVRTVAPDCGASRAGVRPRDAVQFAAVLGPVHAPNSANHHWRTGSGGEMAMAVGGGRQRNLEALAEDDAAAAAYALERERRGIRTSYLEMRRMFEGNTIPPPSECDEDGVGLGPGMSGGVGAARRVGRDGTGAAWGGGDGNNDDDDNDDDDDDYTFGPLPPADAERNRRTSPVKTVIIAATSCAGACAGGGGVDDNDYGAIDPRPSSSYPISSGSGGGNAQSPWHSLPSPRPLPPIVMVFRRTRQRKSLGYSANIGVPTFRLDDECDRAAALVRRLAPPAPAVGAVDVEELNKLMRSLPDPSAWDEMVYDGTEWLLGEESTLPTDDADFVAANGGVTEKRGAAGVSSPSALSGTSASTCKTPCKDGGGGGGSSSKEDDGTIPLDPLEAKSSEKLERVRRKMLAEALRKRRAMRGGVGQAVDGADDGGDSLPSGGGGSNPSRSPAKVEDVDSNAEADTIRGMIQKAVGLAFVRTSKVVMGVSLHGGSGIVIARLPDGTWSAPSAISTFGLGLGIQFGLELADYVFIIQTDDAMDHFRRGGSFTLGGNVGAAMAGMGREAYGAASLGMCDSPARSFSPAPGGGGVRVGSIEGSGSGEAAGADDLTASPGLRGKSRQATAATTAASGMVVGTLGQGKRVAEIAPIVAYARSQGLYFGVSLEGSRISVRDDVNDRTYKFLTGGRSVTAAEILSGAVAAPSEAEELYATLHAVEFTHEIASLPRPPEVLRVDAGNDWRYDRSTLSSSTSGRGGAASPGSGGGGGGSSSVGPAAPFSFLSSVTDDVSAELSSFETKFKKFLYGGVSVQRLVPNAEPGSGGKTRRERRTLWLMLPEVGALRLGFVSKLNDNGGAGSSLDVGSYMADDCSEYARENGGAGIGSDDGDSMTMDGWGFDDRDSGKDADRGATRVKKWKSGARHIQPGKVRLSNKHCVALTDVTVLSQEPNVSIRFDPDDATEHLRVISIQDVSGTSLLFLANNFKEAELLVCGLKLLLERETARLGVRGGVPITQLGGTLPPDGRVMSPAVARGVSATEEFGRYQHRIGVGGSSASGSRRRSLTDRGSGYVSSDNEDGEESIFMQQGNETPSGVVGDRRKIPDGRRSWSQVPARDYLRSAASASSVPNCHDYSQGIDSPTNAPYGLTGQSMMSHRPSDEWASSVSGGGGQAQAAAPTEINRAIPTYFHGQLLSRDVASAVALPLPLPLCRVLLLDSSSPVITKWEADRGDKNYSKSPWKFPPSSPRELEKHTSEHQLIASGSMMEASRTTSYDRVRNGEIVRLAETQVVDADDSDMLMYTVSERMPRRGFGVGIRVSLKSIPGTNGCNATVTAELRPLGKNMSNQMAVHKACLLVLSETRMRYGTEGIGLLAGFLNVVNNLPATTQGSAAGGQPACAPPVVRKEGNRQPSGSSGTLRARPTLTYPEGGTEPGRISNQTENLTSADATQTNFTNIRDLSGARSISERNLVSSTRGDFGGARSTSERSLLRSSSKRRIKMMDADRPPTPSMNMIHNKSLDAEPMTQKKIETNDFGDSPIIDEGDEDAAGDNPNKPPTIAVKPLPKIRLDLMPAPREEDEYKDYRRSSSRSKSKRGGSSSRSRRRS